MTDKKPNFFGSESAQSRKTQMALRESLNRVEEQQTDSEEPELEIIDITERKVPCSHEYEYRVTHEPTCGDPGERIATCKLCGEEHAEVIYATGKHKWDDGVTVKEPTTKEEGLKKLTCKGCGKTKDEKIPMLPKPKKETLTMTIDEEVYRGLKKIKGNTDRTISSLVEEWYHIHKSEFFKD